MSVFDQKPRGAKRSHQVLSRRATLRAAGGLALLAAAAACGDNGAGGDEIEQWYHEYGEESTRDAAFRFAEAYKKEDVRVNWVKGGDQYGTKISAALLGNRAPDTFEWQLTTEMVQADQVVEVGELLDGVRDDFTQVNLDLGTVDGKLYGIPMIQDMHLLYYRKSLLDHAGIKPPTTFDDLLDAAKELTTDDRKGLFVGNDGGVAVLGAPALASAGLTYVTADHQVGFDDPRAIQGLDNIRRLAEADVLLRDQASDWYNPDAFIEGKCAMQWTGFWTMPVIQDKLGDDFGVLPYPALDAQGAPAVPTANWLAMVCGKSDKIDAAKDFVKWLWVDQTDFQLEWAQSFGFHVPVRTSVQAMATKIKSGPAAEAVQLVNDHGVPVTPPDWTAPMSTAYTDALTNIINDGADPEQELPKVIDTATKELNKLYG